ncbi:hypothetical protein FOL47_004620 [Perkinsus chesapeaki]|uniref:PIH1 N-terminal domain-containing protein n=1 Tax=Perkinsus chesapeaki TaxID=330153 RepID=A0A7J6M2W4_PERCH|nr:hypothetical protein FOL47_004620 [Perkinsus chesapeaki]
MLSEVDLRFGSSRDSSANSEQGILLRQSDQGVTVKPEPGFVVKTRDRKTREKIFVNLTGSEYVEAPHVKSFLDQTEQQQGIRVPMSIGEKRSDIDRKGGSCIVVDVVFNPEVLTRAMNGKQGVEYKQTICQLALSGIGRKYGMDSLDMENFVLPKMRYKGAAVPQQRIKLKNESAITEVASENNEDKVLQDSEDTLPLPQFTMFYHNTYTGVSFDGFDLAIYRTGRHSLRENLKRRLFKRRADEEDTYELPLSVIDDGVADSDASGFTQSVGGCSSVAVPVDDPLQPLQGTVCEIKVKLSGVVSASHIDVEASDECLRIRHSPPFSGHKKYRTLIIWFPIRFAGGVRKCAFDGELLKIEVGVDKALPEPVLECDTDENDDEDHDNLL